MKSSLRILYLGTPDFAVAGLQALVESNHQVVGVVTATDKPAKRGRQIQQSAVKKYAVQQDLLVLQPPNLKDAEFLTQLSDLKIDLAIVVAFRMLPRQIWQLPQYGTFNLHASLLPDYRGAAPINWAMINGEKITGVTTFFIDECIDTGNIILQKQVAIDEKDNVKDLHDRLMTIGADLIVETVALISEKGTATPTTQQIAPKQEKIAPKIFKDTCRIDWTNSAQAIYNFVRGLSPYPVAWTTMRDAEKQTPIKIGAVSYESLSHDKIIGSVIYDKNTLKIAVKDGLISIVMIQPPNKKMIPIKDFLNGYMLSENIIFE